MSGYNNNTNSNWNAQSVVFFNALKEYDVEMGIGVKNAIDTLVSALKSRTLEYVVVASDPSSALDESGRKEILAGSELTDSRLYYEGAQINVKTVVFQQTSINAQYITQTSNSEDGTSTVTITNGSSWSEGDIITLFI